MRSLKLEILPSGHVTPVKISTPRGFDGPNPVVEIAGIPDKVTDIEVTRTYTRCIIAPAMHADILIPWDRIDGAHEG